MYRRNHKSRWESMRMTLRNKIYFVSVILFSICAVSMLYFGYKTFYIKPEPTKVADYSYHFALIAEEADNEYWHMIKKGAENAAHENNIFLDYIAPEKADNDEVLILLDRMISAKVDGIITHGIDDPQFVDLVHKGVERGIPIITVDTDVESSERKAYVGSDNYKAGQLLGQAIIEDTKGKQSIGIVTGRNDSISQKERIAGLKQVIESNPEIEIVTTEESNITQVGAARATYTLLKEHPEITVLAGTSALDGIGIVEGLKDIAPNKDVLIIAFDTLPETLQLIQDGKIDATIVQYPEKMGYDAVDIMIDLQKSDLLDNKRYTDIKIIRKEDLQISNGNGEDQ